MAGYLGNIPRTSYFVIDTFSGNDSLTDFTLTEAPVGPESVLVFVGSQVQQPVIHYSVDGTTMTFVTAPPTPGGADPNVVVVHLGVRLEVPIVISGSIGETQLTEQIINTLKSGRKNKFINGQFDIWQRAISQTSSGYGSDDRWINEFVGNTVTHIPQLFTLGQTDVPGNPKFFSRTAVTSVTGAGNYTVKHQRIEYVKTLSGQQAVVSFWAKADAAKDIAVEFVQHFGTGGSPSGDVSFGVTTVSLITTWAKYEVAVTIPSITGKTLGTDENDYLDVKFWLDAGTTYNVNTNALGQQNITFDLSTVQMEAGTKATDFERRPIGEEFALCQRYFTILGKTGQIWCQIYQVAGQQVAIPIYFPTTMRSSPTCSIIGTWNVVNCGQPAFSGPGTSGVSIYVVASASAVTSFYSSGSGYMTADAEL